MEKLIIHNIGLLSTPTGSKLRTGKLMNDIMNLSNAYIVIDKGKFFEIGVGEGYKSHQGKVINAKGALITPGFIDSHNHLVFAGNREQEFMRRIKGEEYLDILKSGGGILETVERTRNASFSSLYDKASKTLDKMLLLGITSLEGKSGYGLDVDTELKQLQVIKELNKNHHQEIIATYLGAHAYPNEYKENHRKYLNIILKTLERIKVEKLAQFCDVFCEEGVFSYDESKEILMFAKALGFKTRIHADEIAPLGGGRLAAQVGCSFADHLLSTSDEDFTAMAQAGVILVILPLTSFILNKDFARARNMIDRNAALAIGTDYNPGSCPSYNILLAMQTAVIKAKLTPAEVLTAVTINPAVGLGLGCMKGTIEEGKDADFIIFNAPNLDYFFYRYGENLVSDVYIKGKKLVSNGELYEV